MTKTSLLVSARPPRVVNPALAALCGFIVFLGLAGSTLRNLVGWPGLTVFVILALIGAVIVLATRPRRIRPAHLPWLFTAFLVACAIGLIWSPDPGTSAIGFTAQLAGVFLACALVASLTWYQLLTVVGITTRLIVAASLVFEFVVALAGHPVPALGVDETWSRGLLFSGGPIQGVPGSASALGLAALIGLIAVALEVAARRVRSVYGTIWVLVFAATIVLSDAAITLVAGLAAAAVLCVAATFRQVGVGRARGWLYLLLAAILAAIVAACVLVFAALRVALTPLEQASLWSSVYDSVGPIALVLLVAAVLGGLWRAWFLATDQTYRDAIHAEPFSPTTLLPLLLAVVLLVRDSLVPASAFQGGWLLLVVVIVGTAINRRSPAAP